MNRIGFTITSLLVALALLSSMLFVVDQRQFGIVYAFGQIKDVITTPGLNFKLPPPFQNVSYLDKRLLTLDSVDTEPLYTAEKQRVVIDWYVRWRVSDGVLAPSPAGEEPGGSPSSDRPVVFLTEEAPP